MPASSQFHVAIIGGGITGVMLGIGLHARNIAYTIYERATGFSEIGAGIGVSPNAEAAMLLIDPVAHAAFKATVTSNGEDYFQWIDGFSTDRLLYRLYMGKDGFQGGRRSEILRCWSTLISPENVQFCKELVDLDILQHGCDSVTMRFSDGTMAKADVVIGCDGVWSQVREKLFGDTCRATYSQQYCFRAVVPMDAAQAALGSHRSYTRFMYNGPGAHAITYPVAKGSMMNVLVVVSDPRQEGTGKCSESDVSSRSSVGHREDAERVFSDWHTCARSVVSLLPPTPDRWAIFDMLEHPAPSYHRGRVALAGDAAHAAGPHLGAGAGFGIEDALVLAELLAEAAKIADPRRVEAALAAYNDVRYERTQWLIKHTRDAVDLFQWRDASAGQDAELFGHEISWRFHHIWDNNPALMISQAKRAFEGRLRGESM